MSQFQRRDILRGAALAAASTAALVATRSAEAGDPSFMNNVPDPLLADDELPTVKSLLARLLPQREHGGGSFALRSDRPKRANRVLDASVSSDRCEDSKIKTLLGRDLMKGLTDRPKRTRILLDTRLVIQCPIENSTPRSALTGSRTAVSNSVTSAESSAYAGPFSGYSILCDEAAWFADCDADAQKFAWSKLVAEERLVFQSKWTAEPQSTRSGFTEPRRKPGGAMRSARRRRRPAWPTGRDG